MGQICSIWILQEVRAVEKCSNLRFTEEGSKWFVGLYTDTL